MPLEDMSVRKNPTHDVSVQMRGPHSRAGRFAINFPHSICVSRQRVPGGSLLPRCRTYDGSNLPACYVTVASKDVLGGPDDHLQLPPWDIGANTPGPQDRLSADLKRVIDEGRRS